MTKELSSEVGQDMAKVVLMKSPSTEETVSEFNKSFSEVQSGINYPQKTINNKFDSLKSSLQAVETSCTSLKQDTGTNNVARRGQCEDINSDFHTENI